MYFIMCSVITCRNMNFFKESIKKKYVCKICRSVNSDINFKNLVAIIDIFCYLLIIILVYQLTNNNASGCGNAQ